jgi:16S rRNA (guanine(966)-N(2))-methyltransferase RsmD
LRVTGGRLKGRRLTPFRGQRIRPTLSKVREALFDIVGAFVVGKDVLDLFCGSGTLGIEALSRGALSAVFVDSNRDAVRVLKKNLEVCGLLECSEIVTASAEQGIRLVGKQGRQFDLVLADPPYGRSLIEKTLEEISKKGIVKEGGTVVIEHEAKEELAARAGCLTLHDRRRYGQTGLSFFTLCSTG